MNELSSVYAADPISPTAVGILMPLIVAVCVYYLSKAVKLRAAGTTSEDPVEQDLNLQIVGYVMIIAACIWAFTSTVLGW